MAEPAKQPPQEQVPKRRESWRKSVRPRPPRYTPNLVPLIDVLFVLLLFFLLIARFHQPEGIIPGALAQGAGIGGPPDPGAIPVEQLVLAVDPDSSQMDDPNRPVVYIVHTARTKTPEDLFAKLEGVRKSYDIRPKGDWEKVQLVLQPRGDVRWKYVAEAFNQAYRAGFGNKIAFAPARE